MPTWFFASYAHCARIGHGDVGPNPDYDVGELKEARDEMLDDA